MNKTISILTLLFSLCLFSVVPVFGKYNIDSLEVELNRQHSVSEKAVIYQRLLEAHMNIQPKKSIEYGSKALSMAKSLNDSSLYATLQGQMGVAYLSISNYSKASEHLFKALKLGEKIEDKSLLSFVYNNIGNLYRHTGDVEKARKFYKKGLDMRIETNDSVGIAHSYNNLGITNMIAGEYDIGMKQWQQSLDIKLAVGDLLGASSTMSNMAMYYGDIGKTEKALDLHNRALRIKKKFEDWRGAAITLSNIAAIYFKEKDYPKAAEVFKNGLQYGEKSQSVNQQSTILDHLARTYEKMGEFKKAYQYHIRHAELKDSIINVASQKQISEIEAAYETEKKELEIENLKKSKALQQAEIQKKDEAIKREFTQKVALGGGFLLTLVMAFVVFRSYRRKKRDNNLIQKQKEQVEHQKEMVEEKNNEIIDSITYSKRLQNAILPPEKHIRKLLPQSFVLYKPKDIVAGDFYWVEEFEGKIYFAAADCTGHGVPGAMVSVICHNALNRALNEMHITDPGKLLDKVSELVEQTFEKSSETVKDGMDIALCSLDPDNGHLEFSGANNPLWIFRKGISTIEEIEVIKGDKQPVGNHFNRQAFSTHRLDLNKGDSLYIFSDGYPDQFGGSKGKKLKPKNLKRLLLSVQKEVPDRQKEIMDAEFEKWKGDAEQVDDVCLIGFRY